MVDLFQPKKDHLREYLKPSSRWIASKPSPAQISGVSGVHPWEAFIFFSVCQLLEMSNSMSPPQSWRVYHNEIINGLERKGMLLK